MKKTLLLFPVLFLTGCANELHSSIDSYMKEKNLPAPSAESFPHCEGYGCPVYKNVKLNARDWKIITHAFGRPAKNAEDERRKIAGAIGVFEQIVGPLTGTDVDRAGTFLKMGEGQLDCVDESTNTTIYMMLLRDKGLIRFHDIQQPQVRWPILSGRGWMHQTAVITETKTGKAYAIDSWFGDNGDGAWVVPLETWRDGWHPDMVLHSAVDDAG